MNEGTRRLGRGPGNEGCNDDDSLIAGRKLITTLIKWTHKKTSLSLGLLPEYSLTNRMGNPSVLVLSRSYYVVDG